MNIEIIEAKKEDLSFILDLYSDEEIDNGNILPIEKAEQIFKKIQSYPNYKIYIVKYNKKILNIINNNV